MIIKKIERCLFSCCTWTRLNLSFSIHRADAFSLRFGGNAGCRPTLWVIKRRLKSLWSCIEMRHLGENAFISAFVVDSKDWNKNADDTEPSSGGKNVSCVWTHNGVCVRFLRLFELIIWASTKVFFSVRREPVLFSLGQLCPQPLVLGFTVSVVI